MLDVMPLGESALESCDLRALRQPAGHQRLSHRLPFFLAHGRLRNLNESGCCGIHRTG
jgi:hypothetical protein